MRCPKCKTGVTSRERKCSGCGLLTPYGRHLAATQIENDSPQWQQEIKRLNRTPVKLNGRELVVFLAVIVLLSGGASYWYAERKANGARLSDPKEEAVMLVMQSACAQGGTIDDRLGKVVDTLARKQDLEALPGWNATPPSGQTCRVSFTYKKNDSPEQIYEWLVNLEQRLVQPENDLARHITKGGRESEVRSQ